MKRVAAFGCLILVCATGGAARAGGATTVALVTSERQNELLAVSLPDGEIIRRIRLPAGPENVEAVAGGPTVVVSSKAGVVSIYGWRTLRLIKRLGGFREPHIVALSPGGHRAYVTDDAAGTLSVIDLARARIIGRVYVGPEAHHLAISPDDQRIWVALGEKARRVLVLDNSRVGRPRVIARVDPIFYAHDLVFSPDGKRVWITSSDSVRVGVFAARTGRLLFTVAVGRPPQHVAFGARGYAYVTSGYSGRIACGRRALRMAPSM